MLLVSIFLFGLMSGTLADVKQRIVFVNLNVSSAPVFSEVLYEGGVPIAGMV